MQILSKTGSKFGDPGGTYPPKIYPSTPPPPGDLRKTAMESMAETKKRSVESEEGDTSVKRKRRSGSDAVEYLRERAEKEIKIREEELVLKKQKQDQEASKQSQLFHQQNEMLKAMKDQQIQMQNMQAMMFQQQQQQTTAFLSMLDRFIPKQ